MMDIVPHQVYEGMYYLQYADGTLSDDFYNKTRAIEHCRLIEAEVARQKASVQALEGRTEVFMENRYQGSPDGK